MKMIRFFSFICTGFFDAEACLCDMKYESWHPTLHAITSHPERFRPTSRKMPSDLCFQEVSLQALSWALKRSPPRLLEWQVPCCKCFVLRGLIKARSKTEQALCQLMLTAGDMEANSAIFFPRRQIPCTEQRKEADSVNLLSFGGQCSAWRSIHPLHNAATGTRRALKTKVRKRRGRGGVESSCSRDWGKARETKGEMGRARGGKVRRDRQIGLRASSRPQSDLATSAEAVFERERFNWGWQAADLR